MYFFDFYNIYDSEIAIAKSRGCLEILATAQSVK